MSRENQSCPVLAVEAHGCGLGKNVTPAACSPSPAATAPCSGLPTYAVTGPEPAATARPNVAACRTGCKGWRWHSRGYRGRADQLRPPFRRLPGRARCIPTTAGCNFSLVPHQRGELPTAVLRSFVPGGACHAAQSSAAGLLLMRPPPPLLGRRTRTPKSTLNFI